MKIQELDETPPPRPARPPLDDPDGPGATPHRVVVPLDTPRPPLPPAGHAPEPFPAHPPERKDSP